MCPSYRATGDEQHSTRGRARLLWEMLAGDLRREGFRSEAVHEALDLCLSCKACKTECPVAVDMAAYKAEFLAQHYKGRLHPLHHYIFGFADKLARWGSLTPALTNAILTGPLTSPLDQAHRRRRAGARTSAAGCGTSFGTGHESNRAADRASEARTEPPRQPRDRNESFYGPTPGTTTTIRKRWPPPRRCLPQAGFQVIVPKGHICCGRPLYDFGHLGAARTYLADVLDRMAPHIDAGLPFIFLEPSCASVFKDELPELFPNDPRAERMREQVWLLADWLADESARTSPPAG